MFLQPETVRFDLPEWVVSFSQTYEATLDIDKRMDFVIAASQKNVEERTGGPFAAAVFESVSGRLVSLGVNLVEMQGLSMLHAEMVAIALAQKKLKTYDLGGESMPDHEVFCSAEPCAMCLGAIPWSGIRRVVTAATDQDARNIGFDEGAKPKDWVGELKTRGIDVIRSVRREEACRVLGLYRQKGGHLYNSREK